MTIHQEVCPVCGGVHLPFERWVDGDHELSYRICTRCAAVFQSPRMSDKALAEFYARGYRTLVQGTEEITNKDHRIQVGRARHLIGLLQRSNISPTAHLDIGASSGVLLLLSQQTFKASVTGIEPGEAYRRQAVDQGLEYYADLAELPSGRRFDLISMIHVLEHLPDPVAYLQKLRDERLTEGGRLLLEVPNLLGHAAYEVSHLTAYSTGSLKRCLQLAGYRVVRSHTHGNPRSPILRLYLTALAEPSNGDAQADHWHPNLGMLRRRRAWGNWFRDMMSYRLPNWTWKEYPEL